MTMPPVDAPSPTVRSALSALYAAMRAGYEPNAPRPDTAPDYGHDPRFLDQLGPLLEFLYAKYFRISMLGMENIPLKGPALLVANHSGGVPYDGALLLHAI